MKRYLPIIGLVLTLHAADEVPPRAIQVAEPPPGSETPVPDTVISRSGQFRVSGGDGLVRGTVAMMAEETKEEFLRLTGEAADWKVRVNIRLHGRMGDPLPLRTVALRRIVVDGTNGLRLDVHLSRGVERERFKRAVTKALLYERALLAGAGDDPEALLMVPPWLADGLCEASAWRLDQSDRRLYEALFRQGGLFKIDDLFALDEAGFEDLDAAMRAAFRVSSGALVMALLEQPQGLEGFRGFLTAAAGHQGEMPTLLRKYFPELNLSENSLEKWWALQLAAKGGLNLATDILTIQQTETALAEALLLNFRTAEGILEQKDLTSWPELAALPEAERVEAVRLAQDSLVRLSYRCFPSYRPLLVSYQAVLDAIARNKTGQVSAMLAELDESRVTMIVRAARGRDYLDWFEITRARETSGAFDDYLMLKERLKSNPHRRKDPISVYLDRMDRIFHREEEKSPFATGP
jgi:hypothetical protein